MQGIRHSQAAQEGSFLRYSLHFRHGYRGYRILYHHRLPARVSKYPIADFEITPDVAIVDPDLAETMPKKLVAHTGMDAMTHAIEAYVSTANCDYTDPLAIHAIKMIKNDLIESYNGDMAKRDSMHNAQCLAGMAFSNALLGIVHSMAHKTGAAFADYGAHIIHGAANAMYLPKVIAFNAKDPRPQEPLRLLSLTLWVWAETATTKKRLQNFSLHTSET